MHSRSAHSCCNDSVDPDQAYAQALEQLRAHGLRITAPRKAMLRVLANERRPLSVEELHREVGNRTADLVTIYRSIEAFEKAGVAQRHVWDSGKSCYELLVRAHHHHHVICRECGQVDVLPGCEAERFEQSARNLGYTALTHVLEVYGVCKTCAKK